MSIRQELGLTDGRVAKPAVKRKRGRPSLRDWEAERPQIELLIRSGYGYKALANHYGITGYGMRAVLRRLGIKTKYAEDGVYGDTVLE